MFGSPKSGANAYATIGLQTGVNAASPHKLILMLFEGALIAIAKAAQQTQNQQFVEKAESVTRAQNIITNGLRASLNFEKGGEVAINLEALYDYMNRRLFEAHSANSVDMLNEVHNLLTQIKDAWVAIDPQANNAGMSDGMMQQPSFGG